MTVEHVRTAPVRPAARTHTSTSTVPAAGTRRPTTAHGTTCLVVPELSDGDGQAMLRSLRRRESTRSVLLTRKAGRRELVVLLGGGVRGAVTAEPPGAVRIAGRPAAPAPRGGPALTARELGVLRLVADGRTNRQIGEHLELSALTVKSHLARISRKVGTGDRAEMVAFAIRNALLG
ncbi:helix-turn-helix transcriptional regulator [Cellulomonas bogoriensis]|uniref:LuxR family transcriptional regulator n=1 Tax=Cellulomonas bogoriensis 69B4 = DSM 16987 TaxID=1386082 RepID=A0A0A0BZZ0_9CELL|nr:helix-turn-helix transcriptional regulator [Cellulomonas bogoriensis]KGM13222.1 LuxR family transcriptional regulator [Cellulomonas bogoriensis 69B4 = DSM 16987]